MKLGVFTTLLSNLSLEEALKYFKSLGIEMVEIGCGGYPGNAHANPEELLNDDAKLEEFKALLKKYDVEKNKVSYVGGFSPRQLTFIQKTSLTVYFYNSWNQHLTSCKYGCTEKIWPNK